MIGPHDAFERFLTLTPAGADFATTLGDFDWGASFGGDLMARGALAACRRAGAGQELRSLHAEIFATGTPGARATLRVEQPAPARARVVLESDGELLCALTAGFAPAEPGVAWQADAPGVAIAAPESLPSDVEIAAREGWPARYLAPIEFRRAEPAAWPFPGAADGEPAHWRGWLRPRAPLGDDPALRAAALVFASDYRSHWGVETRLGAAFSKHDYTSLDHALWIHAPLPWSDWWRFDTTSDVCRDGRALVRREVWTREGVRVATVLQEMHVAPS